MLLLVVVSFAPTLLLLLLAPLLFAQQKGRLLGIAFFRSIVLSLEPA